jgi:hypothetical protein
VIFLNRCCAGLGRPGKEAFKQAVYDAGQAVEMCVRGRVVARRAARRGEAGGASRCAPAEKPYYSMARSMARARDARLTPNFKWYLAPLHGDGPWATHAPVDLEESLDLDARCIILSLLSVSTVSAPSVST